MDSPCHITSFHPSVPAGSSRAPSTRNSSPDSSNNYFVLQSSSTMEPQYHNALQGSVQGRQSRLFDRNQQSFQQNLQNLQNQQIFGSAAPRSVVSPNWRAPPADANNWMPSTPNNYQLTSPPVSRGEVFDGKLAGYAYCLDRGNGQYTRLVPADMLPALAEIPPRQTGPNGMVVLPSLQLPPPQGVPEMNRPVTFKVRVALSMRTQQKKRKLSA